MSAGEVGIIVLATTPVWLLAVIVLATWLVVDCGAPWSMVGKARAARRERWKTLVVEFLTYGYDEGTANKKADEKMMADAKAAEEVK